MCAFHKINSDLKLATYERLHAITLFSVHVNSMFGFINWNDLIPIETKGVHVNVASYMRNACLVSNRH